MIPKATDFTDLPLLPNPAEDRPEYLTFKDSPPPEAYVHCPVCKGHGYWNTKLNAYGPGKHAQMFCSQCWGWGWVLKDTPDATCIHEWKLGEAPELGRCMHRDICTKCGTDRVYDSSD